MGLSNRHFISQPLSQRIIPICNKTNFSDFRNNQKNFEAQKFLREFPHEMKLFVVMEMKKGTIHVGSRGWFSARPSFWKFFCPTKCMWSPASPLPQTTSSQG